VALLTADNLRAGLSDPRRGIAAILAVVRARWYAWRYAPRLRVGRNFRCYGKLVLRGPGRVVFGDDVVVSENLRHVYLGVVSDAAEIVIGSRVWLNGTSISCHQRVVVGERALLGRIDVIDHEFHDPRDFERKRSIRSAPIEFEADTWVGNDCLILKGVRIGRHSVIGARTVVRQSVPERVVAIGNPAQIVKRLGPA
jgi:acetyltransferase-like isoleucine patch superfamily enzyme